MPENTKYVGRGSKWGNPYKLWLNTHTKEWEVDFYNEDGNIEHIQAGFSSKKEAAKYAISQYEIWVNIEVFKKRLDPMELVGKNLACWCSLDMPCHVDYLLEAIESEEEINS